MLSAHSTGLSGRWIDFSGWQPLIPLFCIPEPFTVASLAVRIYQLNANNINWLRFYHLIRWNVGQLIPYVFPLMHPAALTLGVAVGLPQRLPESSSPIANGQHRPPGEPMALKVQQQFLPRLLALGIAIPYPHQLFVSLNRCPHDHPDTRMCGLKSRTEIDRIHPEVHVAFV